MKRYLLVLMMIFYAVAHAEPVYYNDYEMLPYTVIQQISENIEIRQYPAAIAVVAEDSSNNNAFRSLFDYISGNNVSPQASGPVEVAMTVPVEYKGSNQPQKMAFFLPSHFEDHTAPIPNNPAVKVKKVPSQRVATIRYSGYNTDRKIAKYEAQLRKTLQENNLITTEGYTVFGYDSPFTLWWLRRNEIVIKLVEM